MRSEGTDRDSGNLHGAARWLSRAVRLLAGTIVVLYGCDPLSSHPLQIGRDVAVGRYSGTCRRVPCSLDVMGSGQWVLEMDSIRHTGEWDLSQLKKNGMTMINLRERQLPLGAVEKLDMSTYFEFKGGRLALMFHESGDWLYKDSSR